MGLAICGPDDQEVASKGVSTEVERLTSGKFVNRLENLTIECGERHRSQGAAAGDR